MLLARYGIAGSAKGGTATATVTISNTGNIATYDAGGISGYASAHANGDGKGGTGGTAVATTTISNTGIIFSYGTGIYGGTDARAHGYKSGGTATATTLIVNTGSIKTYGEYAPGIYATSTRMPIHRQVTARAALRPQRRPSPTAARS